MFPKTVLYLKTCLWLEADLKFPNLFLLQLLNEPRSKASMHQMEALNVLSDHCQSYRWKLTSDFK